MKERILKWGVPLFLVAVLIAAGALSSHPGNSQAAAKKTTYNVVIQKDSPAMNYISINGGAPAPTLAKGEGITFKMVVEEKAKTEKVKSTGGKATYYPVTILAKSYSQPTERFPMVGGGGYAISKNIMKKDAKGKLYIEGGDVDVSGVQGKKLTTKIGDGTVDPAGSLITDPFTVISVVTMEDTGKVFMQTPTTCIMTTGKSYLLVKGTKTRFEGKAMPNDDTTKALPVPLVGQPVDLEAGTGTLVGTGATLNQKNKTMGLMDYLQGKIWVMKITKQ